MKVVRILSSSRQAVIDERREGGTGYEQRFRYYVTTNDMLNENKRVKDE
jgi:hypothetical protein